MEFKFNFGDSDDQESREDIKLKNQTTPSGFVEAKEVFPSSKEEEFDEEAIEALFEKVSIQEDVSLSRCRPPNTGSLPSTIAAAIDHSDLVPGVYEGGFKIWEGSIDLVRYLLESAVPLQGKKVIELGCGHGFPGIFALQQGAEVDFQDYNPEVIDEVLVPNILINFPSALTSARPPRYFCGDWAGLPSVAFEPSVKDTDGAKPKNSAIKYDLVLTAETIYSPESIGRLLDCIERLLQPGGVAYVAAKSYYFGVGGSTHNFIEAAKAALKGWTIEQVNRTEDGSSNVREILRLSSPTA